MRSPVALLAKRFLWSKSADGFISLISIVSIVGVFLGVAALTVVTSVINGFEGELKSVITGMNGDVVFYTRGDPMDDSLRIAAEIRRSAPEVDLMSSSLLTEVMAVGPGGVAGAVLQGIDPQSIGAVTKIPERLVSGRLPQEINGPRGEPPIVELTLTEALAEKLGYVLPLPQNLPELRIVAPFLGPGDAPQALRGQVVGIVKMGMYEYDSKFIFIELGALQDFLGQPGKFTHMFLKLKSGGSAVNVAQRLGEGFGYPFRAKDWGQLNKNLFYAIQLEKVVIAIILTVIVIVAAFNVVSTLMMMIHDKTREIAILKAMGFRPAQSFRLFCSIGSSIGLVGTASGVLGGLGLGWVLARTQFIRLPADVYYIGFLPVVVRWTEIALIAGVALVISFLATLYPAWNVSRRSPLEGLRYD